MTDNEYDGLMSLLAEEAQKLTQYRSENPCCDNCKNLYCECGTDFCKVWDSPMENIYSQKCSQWR